MSHHAALRKLSASLIAAATILNGCASIQRALDSPPTASIENVKLSRLSVDSIGLDFEVEIQNPYPVALPVLDLSYSLASDTEPFAQGEQSVGGTVPASGRRTVTLPLDLSPSELLRTVGSLRPGQVLPYRATLTLGVDPPALAPLELPLHHQGELPIPTAPTIRVASIRWTELGLTAAAGTIALDVTNPNEFGFDLTRLTTGLSLAGRNVATLTTSESLSWSAGDARRLELPLRFSPTDLGIGAFQMLTGGDASYSLDGGLDVQTRFGSLHFPIGQSGQTSLSR